MSTPTTPKMAVRMAKTVTARVLSANDTHEVAIPKKVATALLTSSPEGFDVDYCPRCKFVDMTPPADRLAGGEFGVKECGAC